MSEKRSIARPLSPEDIDTGDYVTLLEVTWEYPSFLWCADASIQPPTKQVRLTSLPDPAGVPMKVRGVCLPFVLVKLPGGDVRSLDVRRHRLARLDPSYARTGWELLKKAAKKQPKGSAFGCDDF